MDCIENDIITYSYNYNKKSPGVYKAKKSQWDSYRNKEFKNYAKCDDFYKKAGQYSYEELTNATSYVKKKKKRR
ncbi:hypothetical protein ACFLY2_03255 [Patescibacteria group bacterium]